MEVDIFSAEETVISSSAIPDSVPDLRILHYNDVYHIEPSSAEPIGGIARFQHVVNYYREDAKHKDPGLIVLFSGDAFNPSTESCLSKGSHMVQFLKKIGTSAACVGNHDLDFGVKQFRNLASQCDFPWLLANVLDPALGEGVPLGNASPTLLLTASNGTKVGLIGLVEREWLDTINSLPPDIIYKSASATAKELIPALRSQGADIIIAITHQREPNDTKLAANCGGELIDLILGGHDHYYSHGVINGTHVLRSGSDFKQLSYIEARQHPGPERNWDFHIVRRDIMSSLESDAATVELVESLTAGLKSKLEKPIGYTVAPLDARFTTVRLKESNIGNFVCDIMRHYYDGDCCIMAAGTIRGDQIYPPGVLKLKDIMDCFPFEDPVVVVKVTGKAIWEALENSVAKYPALEGRFPQVSNIDFVFDPIRPEGSRILSAKINKVPLELAREYVLVTRDYMTRGKDGFTSLLTEDAGGAAKVIVSEENGILISMMLRQYFLSLKVLGRWSGWSKSLGHHWNRIQSNLHQTHPVKAPEVVHSDGASKTIDHQQLIEDDEILDYDKREQTAPNISREERELAIKRKVMRKWWRLTRLQGHPSLCDEEDEGEFQVDWTKAIAPRLEGRIRMV